tara:strand:+ start:324 stop:734 length:411 start_codon:yes stop_codon:yes gene_type:complete
MACITPVGVTLEYGATDSGGTVVGSVVSITPGAATVSTYDVTALADTTVQKIASGRTDPGSMSFECYFNPTDTTNLDELEALLGTSKYWLVKFNNTDASTYIGEGLVTSVEIGSIQDDAVRFTITIEKTGTWAFTE